MSSLFKPEAPAPTAADLAASVFVRVAVERSVARRTDESSFAEAFTYRVAPNATIPAVGQRVRVPLGRGDAHTEGFVVDVGTAELAGNVALSKIKPIIEALPGTLPPTLVTLGGWIADYYVCPLGMVFATMIPAAVKRGTGRTTQRLIQLATLDNEARDAALATLKPAAAAAFAAITAAGLPEPVEPLRLVALAAAKNLAPINQLLKAGLLEWVERHTIRSRAPLWQTVAAADAQPTLTPDQHRVVEGISATLGSFGTHLLRGVTGSGKTEVYLRIIERVIERGQSALVLVPEISLTPQTAGRFLARFGRQSSTVAVLHSGLSAAERNTQWQRANSPACRVVVGARSAIFAPLTNLGVIVVDEEHASDYKQDQLPRYHGRDVAIKRAQLERCPVILGSATPSLESWANAVAKRFTLWELPHRVGAGRLPAVEIVDLARERAEHRTRGPLAPAIGPTLRRALLETLCDGGQAILLLNRRGYSSHVCCPSQDCGWVQQCTECDAAMVLHKASTHAGEFIRCHHCLAEQIVPATCPQCQRRAIRLGVGTQRVEEELAEALAGWPDLALHPEALVRVDGDTMRSARDYFHVLDRFGKGHVKILLGTQMIAKGLDFPNVRLAGVINADIGLSLPDFRASERAFQLITQVAGRAGRGDKPGRVIVQTVNPKDPAIIFASRHDYVAFATRELAIRSRSGLPPASRMARIVIRDAEYPKALARAEELAALLAPLLPRGGRLTGPAPAPLARVAGQHRLSIELIAARSTDLHTMLATLARQGLLKSDAHTAVDVDPIALM